MIQPLTRPQLHPVPVVLGLVLRQQVGDPALDTLQCADQHPPFVRYQLLMAGRVKMAVFWIVSRSQVEVHRRFGHDCWLHHQGDTIIIALMMEAISTSETYSSL
jgi:hypothetical protein